LLFHCYSAVPKSPRFGRKPLKLLVQPRATGPKYSKNSLLIPLLPQIMKRFQYDGASWMEAGQRPEVGLKRRANGA
jgi:hypothetical protein